MSYESLYFNGIPVKRVNETKHLGMILDSKLSFEKHLEDKFAKTNRGNGSKSGYPWNLGAILQMIC